MLVLRRLFCNWEESDMVEWKKLGDLCNITTGRLNANQKDENGIYPFFTCDETPYKINKYAFDTEAILLSGNGSQVGHLNYYKGKFNAYQRTYVLDDFKGILLFYLFHYLKCTIRPYIMKSAKKGAVPYITLPMLTEFEIPIPSKSEQERIVSILDTFTSSISNLKEQIKERRKQYEYYRDQLLDLEGKDGVEMKTLPQISKNLDRKRKAITSTKRVAGLYPYYGASGIVDYVESYIFDGNYLLISEDGANLIARTTPIAFSIKGKNWVNNHAHVLEFDNLITQKYVEIYLNHIDLSFWINGAAQPKLNQENLNKIEFPLPSKQEQLRIVTILDQFEASIANLEAQLKEREKQYEYYRNQLLTFE